MATLLFSLVVVKKKKRAKRKKPVRLKPRKSRAWSVSITLHGRPLALTLFFYRAFIYFPPYVFRDAREAHSAFGAAGRSNQIKLLL